MDTQVALARRLDGFLATRGATRDMLIASVAGPFGQPLLIVATGSILHGFGNQRSDIDVNVIVEQDVAQLPLSSYIQGILLDTTYFPAPEVESWISDIRDHGWPPLGRLDRKNWERRLGQLFNCTRFGYGLVLSGRDGWDDRMADFKQPWLRSEVARWWQIESVRRQLAARWLAEAKPLLSAQRYLEAVFAAFESRAAAAGHAWFGTKWLLDKLRAIGDHEGFKAVHGLMRTPTLAREARDYMARCEALLEEIRRGPGDRLMAQLWYLPGVQVRDLASSETIVSRWKLRGLELCGEARALQDPPEPIWEGELDAAPPSDVLSLFVGDFTWLSIVAREQ